MGFLIYATAFIVGAIVMSFEMLGSRYLNPYFGSGIYTWASLISTVLAALTLGYFIGGHAADRRPNASLLGVTVIAASLYLLVLPLFAHLILDQILAAIDDTRLGSLVCAMAIMFLPVTLFGMYSPFAIRLILPSADRSGSVSGMVYGISTAGSIVGTLGTTFFLIPQIGTRAITISLGALGVFAGGVLLGSPWLRKNGWFGLFLLIASSSVATTNSASGEDLIDSRVRAVSRSQPDGQMARIESPYNNIYITKRGAALALSVQVKGTEYTESVINLSDPDDLPLAYTQTMTLSVAYPTTLKRILMVGLGGGSISTYLGRSLAETAIDVVELDPAIIASAKSYFGIRETDKVRYIAGDGRVFLARLKEKYDLIIVDAFRGSYVPFHMLTKEFYELIKASLTKGGAASFNIHEGNKLYSSTIRTLRAVFPTVDLYPSGAGETIVVVSPEPGFDASRALERASLLQAQYKFRFALPELLSKVTKGDMSSDDAQLITDDFAPVEILKTIGRRPSDRH